MSTPYTSLAGRESIIAAADGSLFANCFAGDGSHGLSGDGAVAWNRQWGKHNGIMAYGAPEEAGRLAAALAAKLNAVRVTVPEEIYDGLPPHARPDTVSRWLWFHTSVAPPAHPLEPECQWLDVDDFPEITALLEEAFPTASHWPDKAAVGRRWFGRRDDNTELTACGLATAADGAGPMLGSIAVHPKSRRRGLASAVTTWVTRALLDEGHSFVGLGSYAADEDTHRIYRRLGYRDVYMMVSGRISAAAD